MKIRDILENIILLIILLVIVQTITDEYAVLMKWPMKYRIFLVISAFAFDAIFTLEFLVRAVIALKNRALGRYLLQERGWIDFVASIPLLLFISGPAMLDLFFPGLAAGGLAAFSVLNVLKVIKAIRVTRILRLLRILKIFGKIQNAESKMAQRHISTISTTVVISIIIVLVIFNMTDKMRIPERFFPAPKLAQKQYEEQAKRVFLMAQTQEAKYGLPLKHFLTETGAEKFGIIGAYQVRREITKLNEKKSGDTEKEARKKTADSQEETADESKTNIEKEKQPQIVRTVYETFSEDDLKKTMLNDDWTDIYLWEENSTAGYALRLDLRDVKAAEARFNIIILGIIIFAIMGIVIIYTRVFAQSVSDPIYVMQKGFAEDDYLFEVKILKPYADEEIFQLAKQYNDVYLPLKAQTNQGKEASGADSDTMLSMDDFLGK